jgi:membrane-associated progesterone receptor component
MSESTPATTGVLGSILNTDNLLGYIVIISCALVGYAIFNSTNEKGAPRTQQEAKEAQQEMEANDDEDEDPPRNFTAKQLSAFDGSKDAKSEELKEVYLSLNGIVFDVSEGRNFYGPGGPYEQFAGHECGIALAKMSFDTEHLDDVSGCKNLNFGEKEELNNWIEKFTHYRCYPIKGRLIPDADMPDPNRIVTKSELAKYTGVEKPENYGAAPIYVGAKGKVYDVSFGGVLFYGKNCSYEGFAGVDASRALALMSLDPKDAANPDISDLNEKQLKVLDDWVKTFGERKGYPVVGTLE